MRVCTHDRGQDSPMQTEYARLVRCLLYGKQEQFNSLNVSGTSCSKAGKRYPPNKSLSSG